MFIPGGTTLRCLSRVGSRFLSFEAKPGTRGGPSLLFWSSQSLFLLEDVGWPVGARVSWLPVLSLTRPGCYVVEEGVPRPVLGAGVGQVNKYAMKLWVGQSLGWPTIVGLIASWPWDLLSQTCRSLGAHGVGLLPKSPRSCLRLAH